MKKLKSDLPTHVSATITPKQVQLNPPTVFWHVSFPLQAVFDKHSLISIMGHINKNCYNLKGVIIDTLAQSSIKSRVTIAFV